MTIDAYLEAMKERFVTDVSPQKSVAESPSVAGCHEGGKRAY